jgi:hypothetical protein
LHENPKNALAIIHVLYYPHLYISVALCDHPQGVEYNVTNTIKSCVWRIRRKYGIIKCYKISKFLVCIYTLWVIEIIEKISWTDHVRNEEVLLRVSEQRNILHEIRKRKANWIGHIVRRKCLLKQVIEGKINGQIEVTRRRGRRRKKLLDDLGDRRGYSHLKEEALDRIKWRNRLGRGCGPVVWQITDEWWRTYLRVRRVDLLKQMEAFF